MGLLTKDIERAPCTVEISHKFESLHAHVRFNNGRGHLPRGRSASARRRDHGPVRGSRDRRSAKPQFSAPPSWNASGPA